MHNTINNQYFEWLYILACGEPYRSEVSYRKLLTRLHNIDFRYSILKDRNRADDGICLRRRFAMEPDQEYSCASIMRCLDGECSVLEMLVALAIRCEENIMDDPRVGDRTKQWFWNMLKNLGLGSMTDNRFNRKIVDEVIERFLDRKYEPNGRGGLFTIRDCEVDLRTVEIWYQLCWYLDTIT